MHPSIFDAFERICRTRGAGGRVLEVGALPTDEALLTLPALQSADERVGLNVTRGGGHRGFEVVVGSANAMGCFADESFDTVLSNATLEHDRNFWKTLGEIRRVTRPGGLVVIGVPAFVESVLDADVRRWVRRIPVLRRRWRSVADTSTLTYRIHDFPGDYYRFSTQAVAEVLLEGMEDVEVEVLLTPPRAIGSGRKPMSPLAEPRRSRV